MTADSPGFTCWHRVGRRFFAACATALALSAVFAPPAVADAPGPTDYQSEIASIEPPTSSIAVSMIGGDSFVRLEQLEPVEVLVIGYRGEDYLRFDVDGTVHENQRSPSTWLNQERFGTEDELPPFVDYQAPPQWVQVADGGAYSWHDHRSHWMNPQRPPGAEPGDQVLEATVPLLVDDVAVTITVTSFLLPGPSLIANIGGFAWGLMLAGIVALRGNRTARAVLGLVGALFAAALGVIAFGSVPGETEPSQLLWLLPAIGVACAMFVLLTRNRQSTTVWIDGLTATAGGVIGAWALTRFDALWRALIPSDAAAEFDRLVIAGLLPIAALLVGYGLWGLIRPERLIEPSQL